MIKTTVTTMLLLSVAGTTYADSFDINLHDDAVQMVYGTPVGDEARGMDGELGVLYTDDSGNSDLLAHAGFLVSGQSRNGHQTFRIGLGSRLILADMDSHQAGAFAFGGRMRFSPMERVGLGGDIWYAPDITTFMDGDRMHEYSLRVDYQLLPHAFVYAGYRHVEIELEDASEYELDSHSHLGMQLFF
ncbi:YfaZ family outer membrane protein [Thiohalomonas denitrificans]|uniref:YfaZ n=1 Tax=Thiohalomonas denitrificans TaxID=415747 RepID=A0A1G5QVQ4_9GAMM|nr:YfaZ family outer membrane protein [Thiohalomonas denitrificans]SCZ65658.1 YfaZ precursor [Thiohalomonas denitrificans]